MYLVIHVVFTIRKLTTCICKYVVKFEFYNSFMQNKWPNLIELSEKV